MLAAVDHALELLSGLSCIVISQKKKFLNHHNGLFYFSEFVSRRKKKF
jgi:hypothetical protein